MLKLRHKILAMGTLLVILTVTVTSAPVLLWAKRDVSERLYRSLDARDAVFERIMQARTRQMTNSVRLLSSDRDLVTAVAAGDTSSMAVRLDEALERIGGELALILDLDGQIIAQAGETSSPPMALPGIVGRAAESGIARSVLQNNGLTYETITVPLRTPLPVGWLTVGFVVDDTLAYTLSELTGLETLMLRLDSGKPALIATSNPRIDLDALRAAITGGRPGAEVPLTYSSNDNKYLAFTRPFVAGMTDIMVVMQESAAVGEKSYDSLQTHLLTVAAAVLAIMLIGGNWIASSISGPLNQLLVAARRIREGDYSEAVHVRNNDELAELAVAFNGMQEGIAEREERITYQAQFDELTGLPNRILALERLAEAIGRSDELGDPLSLLVVDLNSFAEVGSSLGHEIGDSLLAQAAERLRASLDARHILARLEGDEFLVVMEGTGPGAAREAAEDLLRLLSAGLSVRDVNVSLDARIGICAFPDHGTHPDKLLLRAAVAKNDAKQADESIHVYEDGREERHVRQLAILGDLRRAARQDEFKLFLQPKINLGDGSVCGAEALVRWDHPSLGFLMPSEFIPVAEQSGNISLITHWALTASIRECRLWQEEGLDLSVSVNLSVRDLLNKDLPFLILELLRDHDLDASRLILELTEQALVKDLAHAGRMLSCLRDLGAKVAMDDFGTGYSSLVQLKNLPVDEVKIDRSFVMELPGNRADVAIVRAAIDLAHSLGMEVLAEGVENASTLRWLEAHGCERAQGFLISKPMPAEQFSAWVENYTAQTAARAGDPGRAAIAISRTPGKRTA